MTDQGLAITGFLRIGDLEGLEAVKHSSWTRPHFSHNFDGLDASTVTQNSIERGSEPPEQLAEAFRNVGQLS